ncbi:MULTISPECIES: (2,3-dihydroxybenzoyl)adenylate synthase [Virgibacillus]|uniref:2,3-dihydroxybenzoate-AMP ligase n=2 Tax=Virgibacillus TaxID=84406 RepID=A0A024Q9Z6_9BACI|nr:MULTISPECIES: (2,3-dihydroxybenzoyl)adenylate synthase [Virgibacillus]EQB35744.1 hypothetical protein M948_11930 [Virgibacillus sp. CM-4]GGJ50092.1 2,3-dihydroxybenzoate-AMP ligase [Virgibacillus kapii]CDQ39353.1 2,3-dihydroxybenzoate-AMP ligase [Virgibacillus massiliensis]
MVLAGCPTWPDEFATFYREKGCWQGKTFGQLLQENANKYGNQIAMTDGETEVSYSDFNANVDQLAAGLQRLGIQKEDRVVVQLPNQLAFFDVVFALFRLGAIPVYALPAHRYSEISYFCEFAEAKAYIIPDTYGGFNYTALANDVQKSVNSLEHIIVHGETNEYTSLSELYLQAEFKEPEIKASEIAFLQLSGGSTGLSKLIPRTHDDYIYTLHLSNQICRINENSVFLAVLPIAHNFPMSSPGVLGILYAGGKVVLSLGSSPDKAFPLIEKEQVNITALVPPIALIWLEAIKSHEDDLTSLQVIQVGGAKFSAEVAKRIQPAFDCKLQQVFGMAEGLVNYTRLDDPDEIIVHTQGKPMSAYDEIRIVDEEDTIVPIGEVGELLTRGPYTIRGYYMAPVHNRKAFTSDGFYRTGDLVSVNEHGYITVEGRDKDQINRGGEKIAAEEVENHLLAHANVFDAAIVAMPDKFLGERTCAFLILKSPSEKPADFRNFLREKGLAAYKIPDRVEIVEAFPQTPFGKVSKKTLRQQIAQKINI